MVATTDSTERVVIRLNTTELMLDNLPEVAAEWEQPPGGERAAWSIGWGNELAGLERLSCLAACGALKSDHYARYQQLLVKLGELAPVILGLQLTLPQMLRDR